METLNQVVAINLDIHLWSGRKRLRKEDLKRLSDDQIPPQELASLGSKKICDPKEINEFERLKRQAERACSTIGVRLMGGYAISEQDISRVSRELEELRKQFNQHKDDFIQRYDDVIETWVNAHPDWEAVIRRAVTPKQEVKRQLAFDYQIFRIQPVQVEASDTTEQQALAEGLERKTSGLAGQLFKEISGKAKQLLETTFAGKSAVTRRSLRVLVAIQEKMNALSFLDPRINPVNDWIQEVMDSMPKTGKLEGSALNTLEAAVYTLADPERVKSLGEARINGESIDENVSEEAEIEWQTEAENEAETIETQETESESDPAPNPVPVPQETPNQSWFF